MVKPSIILKENRCILTWQEDFNIDPFCNALSKSALLDGLTIISSRSQSLKSISFFAQKICTMREMIGPKYEYGVLLAKCLGQQLFYLEKQGYTFAWMTLDDILVIDETRFMYIGLDQLKCIEKGKCITFTEPFSLKSSFLAPEIKVLHTLPSSVDYRATYYSLGVMICMYLFKEPHICNSILHTKLYWFLLLCLENDPERRSLLFI